MSVIVSRHAKKRLKQRVHKNYQRAADEAFAIGVDHGRLTGGLKRVVDGVAMSSRYHGSRISAYKIYYGNLYLFDGNVLVTVLQLPARFVKLCARMTQDEHTKKGTIMGDTEMLYAIQNERYGVLLYTISDRKTCTISTHCTRQETTWEECRRRGDRVVRIAIRVVE